jgi:hypothetical protein
LLIVIAPDLTSFGSHCLDSCCCAATAARLRNDLEIVIRLSEDRYEKAEFEDKREEESEKRFFHWRKMKG